MIISVIAKTAHNDPHISPLIPVISPPLKPDSNDGNALKAKMITAPERQIPR